MTAAQILAALIAFAEAAAPYLVEELTKLIDQFQKGHPEIGAPPPDDGEAKIDAEIDARVKGMQPSDAASGEDGPDL